MGIAAYLRYLLFVLKLIAVLKGIGCKSEDFWSILANKSSDSRWFWFNWITFKSLSLTSGKWFPINLEASSLVIPCWILKSFNKFQRQNRCPPAQLVSGKTPGVGYTPRPQSTYKVQEMLNFLCISGLKVFIKYRKFWISCAFQALKSTYLILSYLI